MEENNQKIQMLALMQRPALWVTDGRIAYVNPAAASYFLQPDMEIAPLITSGQAEYTSFTAGSLHLTITIAGIAQDATVFRSADGDVILLESCGESVPLQALSLAAMQLRFPLAGAAAITDRLLSTLQATGSPETQQQTAMLNRRMMQMQRIIGNMADCGDFCQENPRYLEYTDLCSFLEELLERTAGLLAKSGYTLEYTIPRERIYAMIYPQKLERAVFNMLSNAAKFSSAGSLIRANLAQHGSRIAFSVTDQGTAPEWDTDIFTRYLRQPRLEDPRQGLGLGMVLIRATARLHGGAVLVDHPEGAGTRVTITLAAKQGRSSQVRSPILHMDYAGEKDHCLLELSDVLPAELYRAE